MGTVFVCVFGGGVIMRDVCVCVCVCVWCVRQTETETDTQRERNKQGQRFSQKENQLRPVCV